MIYNNLKTPTKINNNMISYLKFLPKLTFFIKFILIKNFFYWTLKF
jgi:hypothetical protein